MQVVNQGYVITDVPNVEKIVVEHDAASVKNVHIVATMVDSNGSKVEIDYGLEEFKEFLDAGHYAYQLAQELADEGGE